MAIYVWCEDSKSGFQFWKALFKETHPDFITETQLNNSRLAKKAGKITIKVHSFEFTLLSFEYLENWVFSEDDELKERRSNYIAAKNSFIKLVNTGDNADELNKFRSVYDFSDKYNTEKIAAKLLYEITRNTGFETDKSKIGKCFINSCCEWSDREDDDACGLDNSRLNANEKMKEITYHSILNAAFKEANLL